jgi:hypothetical protein
VAIDYFDALPPELILVLSPSLSTFSLNALASTFRLFNQILQPGLESSSTSRLAPQLLMLQTAQHP